MKDIWKTTKEDWKAVAYRLQDAYNEDFDRRGRYAQLSDDAELIFWTGPKEEEPQPEFDVFECANTAAKHLYWSAPSDQFFIGFIRGVATLAAEVYQLDEDSTYLELSSQTERVWQTMRKALKDELLSYKED